MEVQISNENNGESKLITINDDEPAEINFEEKHHNELPLTMTGVISTDIIFLNTKAKPRTLFRIPVKDGVTYWNIIAIPLVPLVLMMLSTYLNA